MRFNQTAVDVIRFQINELETQLADLKIRLAEAEAVAGFADLDTVLCNTDIAQTQPDASKLTGSRRWPLDMEEFKRYGRQMILSEIGLKGQLRLKGASVLIIGVGGLGCPAATYLAGAGIGTLGLVDGDIVETSNLHRQILHTTDRIGWHKVTSAVESLRKINPMVHYDTYTSHLEETTALDILEKYDLILDCTDHPTSRYLISDAAVIAGKPLVSASALRTDGQLLILNNPPSTDGGVEGGFCYRCIFPKPPPPESVTSCGEGGILGPVVGVMGVLMAVEAIKVIAAERILPEVPHAKGTLASASLNSGTATPTLLLYSAYSYPPFRSMRFRGKRPNCPSCSASATITRQSLTSGSIDYAFFCGLVSSSDILSNDERLSAKEYKETVKDAGVPHTLVDVREQTQYEICHLENSVNIPFSDITSSYSGQGLLGDHSALQQVIDETLSCRRGPIYFVCRQGNDSQLAVQKLKTTPGFHGVVRDIKGGLTAWRKEVDQGFPEY